MNNGGTRYINSRLSKRSDQSLYDYNQATTKFVNDVKTDFSTFASYTTFQIGDIDRFELYNTSFDMKHLSKIMFLTYRYDLNRTYLESLKLRQYKTSVDSRFVSPGFDFSLYISSTFADQIIESSNGSLCTYDDVLNFDSTGFTFQVNTNGKTWKGHILNILLIEPSNSFSDSINAYMGNFSLFYGPTNIIFDGFEQVLNYDFLLTKQSIKNNLSFLNTEFGNKIKFYDDVFFPNQSMESIYHILTQSRPSNSYVVPLLLVTLFGSVIVFFMLFKPNKERAFFSRSTSAHIVFLFSFHVFYYLFLKILSLFKKTFLFSNILSNTYFGMFSVLLLLLVITYFYIYFLKVKKYRYECES
ncbi:MAG: hypothetical protein V3569_01450 [Acholeplasmataceae bacterium]